MPKTLIDDKKETRSIRLSKRMIERVEADCSRQGLQFGEYVRVAILKMLDNKGGTQ